MKILILTYYLSNTLRPHANCSPQGFCNSYASVAEITNKNKIDYCNYWNSKGLNYTFFPWIGFFGEMPPRLLKIPLILYLFKTTDYDVIFFQDTDTFIMNFTIPIESFLDEEHSLFVTQDIEFIDNKPNGRGGFNAGSFIVKNNAKGLEIFRFLESQMPKYIHWAEQDLIRLYCESGDMRKTVKIVPQRTFNSYFEDLIGRQKTPGNFQKGDYLLHLLQLNAQYRAEILRSDRVQKNIVYPKDCLTIG